MNDDKTRIEHMISHIRRIQTILQGVSETQFYNTCSLVDSVSFNFAVLGEAANKISAELQNRHSEIPWSNIIGMRNILIHDYEKTNPRYMWEAVQNDLNPLCQQLEEILRNF